MAKHFIVFGNCDTFTATAFMTQRFAVNFPLSLLRCCVCEMFFTKPSWQSPMKVAGDAFTRWEMTGVTHYSTVFVVRSAQAHRDDGDGYSYLVFGPHVLKSILEGVGRDAVKVYALEWDRLVSVEELWSYTESGRLSMAYFAYTDREGRVMKCEPTQPDPAHAIRKTVVWQVAEAAVGYQEEVF